MTVAARATAEKKAAEHDLDAAATPVSAFIVSDWLVAESATRYARLNTFGLESTPKPVGVVAAITEQPLWRGYVIK